MSMRFDFEEKSRKNHLVKTSKRMFKTKLY